LLGRKSRLLCLTAAEWEKREAALPHGLRNGPGLSPEKSTTTKGPHKVRLLLASDTPIQRHVKVKCEANPYDPAFETYFEEREGFYMRETFRGTRTLRYIWNEQATYYADYRMALAPSRPSCAGWVKECRKPRSTSSGVP